MKEWARQISELSADDFALLHTATLSHIPNSSDVSIATDEPASLQLSSLLDKLRMGELVTSDSGAVSDYSENTEPDCLKSCSGTSLTFDSEERESCRYKQSGPYSTGVHVTPSTLMITSENSEKNTATQPESDAVHADYVEREVSVAREALAERGKYCQDKGKGATHQTSRLDDDFSSHHTKEVVWSEEEEKKPIQLCKQCKALKTAGNQEKRVPEKRGATETAHARPPEAQKTKRYYGHGKYRRNSGYSRNTSWQSNTSTRYPISSNSSFNHDEVAGFLWKSMFATVLLNDITGTFLNHTFRMDVCAKRAVVI